MKGVTLETGIWQPSVDRRHLKPLEWMFSGRVSRRSKQEVRGQGPGFCNIQGQRITDISGKARKGTAPEARRDSEWQDKQKISNSTRDPKGKGLMGENSSVLL